ncbi:MAG: polyribonucleotide nucleotidyltransferase [Planctomycetaceae bacterium]
MGRQPRRKCWFARRLEFRAKQILCLALAVALATSAISCGTILYPERRGQPHTGRLDPRVVLLDAAGLLLFIVPGLIAFAVDFGSGAIYLPPEGYCFPTSSAQPLAADKLVRVQLPPGGLTRNEIEQIVERETGRSISLQPGTYHAVRLSRIDQFGAESARLASMAVSPTQVLFR